MHIPYRHKIKFEYKITLFYLIIGFTWILCSDRILESIMTDDSITKFQTYKGSFFIVVTSLLLFLLVRRNLRKIEESEKTLIQKNVELVGSEEEIRAANEELMATSDALRESYAELQTAKESIEKSEIQLRYSQKVTRTGYYIFDIKAGSWSSSEMLDEIFGIDANYIRDVNGWLSLIHPDFQLEMRNYLSENILNNHETFNKSYQIVNQKTNRSCWVHGRGTLEFDKQDNLLKMFGTIQDISQSKQVEQELIAARVKAEESDRLKSTFLNNMSHEVRTPLNAIVGFSQLIAMTDFSNDKLQRFADLITESSNKLIGIITDIIDISQIYTKQAQPKFIEFDIVQVIKKIMDSFTDKADEKNLLFVQYINIPTNKLLIFSDSEKLSRIIIHLVDNAIKFTSQGSVSVDCRVIDQQLQISVSDTGIGIAQDMLNVIYEPFRQVETGICRSFGGNGLGLPIVKAYTEMLGGSLILKSILDKGTTVTLTFPVTKLEVSGNKNITEIAKSSVKTILIAEDEYINYLYLAALFNNTRIEILYAADGKQALNLCQNNKAIDLVLMDIKMPIMDGHTAAKLIKEFRPDLHIIAQTAYALDSEKEEFMAVFDDYLIKPISKEDIKLLLLKYADID